MNKLYIPKKLRVGFCKRSDTYTGKLAYIIYYDENDKIRKEVSFENWRDKSIDIIEFENIPSRFVLNKGIQRHGYRWGTGRSVVRVYDQRDFEFEISVDNLIGILMHSDVSKRDIQEECVFAWNGKDLVLLPVNSEQYQESLKFTATQSIKLSTKDLVPGKVYIHKKTEEEFVYIGFHKFYSYNQYCREQTLKGKKHVFSSKTDGYKTFETPSVNILVASNLDGIDEKFAELSEKFYNSIHASAIINLTASDDGGFDGRYLYREIKGQLQEVNLHWSGWGASVIELNKYSEGNCVKRAYRLDSEILKESNIKAHGNCWSVNYSFVNQFSDTKKVVYGKLRAIGFKHSLTATLESGNKVNL